jgi:hypothetical protein
VASLIAGNDPIRASVRVLLYPLLGVLGANSAVYSLFAWTPEFAVVMAGLVASSLIGLVYLTLPALVGIRQLSRRRAIPAAKIAKASLALLAMALAVLVIGESAGSFLLLAIGSSALVLTCVAAAPLLAAVSILRLRSE